MSYSIQSMSRFHNHLLFSVFNILNVVVILFFIIHAPHASAESLCCKCTTSVGNKSGTLCLQSNLATSCDVINQGIAYGKYVDCSGGKITSAQCKTVFDNGICGYIQDADTNYKLIQGETSVDAGITPHLNIPIPGLAFAENLQASGGLVKVPYLAQYISAIYKYMTGLAIITAAIMMTWGGFLYITGETAGTISQAKQIFSDSLIGFVIVVSAYTLLKTINPALIKPGTLDIKQIQGAFLSAEAEFKRVQEAATVPTQSPTPIPATVVVGGPSSGVPPVTITPAPIQPNQKPGAIIKNSKGEFIAQGACPQDMKSIIYSSGYEQKTKAHVQSFCMDTYEAPNIPGTKPFNGVIDWEADWYCNEHGKRLCTSNEWTRACLGPAGTNTYGYGPKYTPGLWVSAKTPDTYAVAHGVDKPAPCNYDSPTKNAPKNSAIHGLDLFIKTPDKNSLNPSDEVLADPKIKLKYDALKTDLARVSNAEPSGARSQCITEEGIYDMTGNVQEIIVKNDSAELNTEQRVAKGPGPQGKAYSWAGFYWDPIAHLANTAAEPTCNVRWGGPHAVNWRGWENGFRCCLDLDTSAIPPAGITPGAKPAAVDAKDQVLDTGSQGNDE